MHILIYGVGRSGTKAIQLYLAYLLALNEENVWINYEPYFWLSRKTKAVNFEGFYHHTHSPHFAKETGEFTGAHRKFLKNLADHDGSIVTKFIRGNGRIGAINEVLKPDHCLIIIRDLYEVLLSVMRTEWDFWSVGWDYQVNWESFIEEVRKKEMFENFDWILSQIEDRVDQNALYWYAMNLAALNSNPQDVHWVDYKRIGAIEGIAKKIFNLNELPEIFRQEKFSGENLHRNYPLEGDENENFYSHVLNQVLYKVQFFKKYGMYLSPKFTGSLAHINQHYFLTEEKRKGTTFIIEKRELFDFFNEDIKSRFNKIQALNQEQKVL
ncbi:MAG: hypothetical protein NTV09_13325 [Bacteroidetes bacterium]|nr:hypothetical protein [Bacteroidota bacterium]